MTKILTGKVIDAGKMLGTVKVEVRTSRAHPLYKKLLKRSKKYLVSLEGKEVKIGQNVKIGQSRPISKNKHFKIIEVMS